MVYSLSHYLVKITFSEELKSNPFLSNEDKNKGLIIGGKGSHLESISISLNGDNWSTKTNSIGDFIHVFNASRTGKIDLEINQVSPVAKKLRKIANVYWNQTNSSSYNNLYPLTSITVIDSIDQTNLIALASNCVITKIPDRKFSDEPSNEIWSFSCGKIEIY